MLYAHNIMIYTNTVTSCTRRGQTVPRDEEHARARKNRFTPPTRRRWLTLLLLYIYIIFVLSRHYTGKLVCTNYCNISEINIILYIIYFFSFFLLDFNKITCLFITYVYNIIYTDTCIYSTICWWCIFLFNCYK